MRPRVHARDSFVGPLATTLEKAMKLDGYNFGKGDCQPNPHQHSRKRDDGNFNSSRAQDSDSNTSQDQEGDTAEKGCGENPKSPSG